jgi:anti-sigma factor RsiW
MHQLIEDHLEEYLRDTESRAVPREFRVHLASCPECTNEIGLFGAQSNLLRGALLAPDVEPAPGFYARVMNRIDEREDDSIWAALLEPAFGRRLAIACGTFALLLGTYLASTERDEHGPVPSTIVMTDQRSANPGDGSIQPSQRDAVLADLVSYHE